MKSSEDGWRRRKGTETLKVDVWNSYALQLVRGSMPSERGSS